MADLKGRQNNASELRNREALIITGINRYIVGCKYIKPCFYASCGCRINRYIVGCKYARKGANNKVACELIDT